MKVGGLHRLPQRESPSLLQEVSSFQLEVCAFLDNMQRNQLEGPITHPWPILTGGRFADFAQRAKDVELVCKVRLCVFINFKVVQSVYTPPPPPPQVASDYHRLNAGQTLVSDRESSSHGNFNLH